jgi:hypothetical protein
MSLGSGSKLRRKDKGGGILDWDKASALLGHLYYQSLYEIEKAMRCGMSAHFDRNIIPRLQS